MFDTNIVVVGNVLTAPEWRRTTNTNSLVANFRVASTARRLDRETGRWVDGNSLRVRVNCWRRLAEGVGVVGHGRRSGRGGRAALHPGLDRREGQPAHHVRDGGRRRSATTWPGAGAEVLPQPRRPAATSAIETAEADGQVRGEAAMPVAEDEAPAVYGDGLLDDERADVRGRPDASAPVRPARRSIEPFDTTMVIPVGDARPDPADPSRCGRPRAGAESDAVPAPESGSG